MTPSSEPIDYNQLLNLRNLEVLRLLHSPERVPLDFISKLFVQLKFLYEFDFQSNLDRRKSRITISCQALPLCIVDPESYAFKLAFPYELCYGEEPLDLKNLYSCKNLEELAREIYRMADHEVIRNCLVF